MPHPADLLQDDPVRAYRPSFPPPREPGVWERRVAPALVGGALVLLTLTALWSAMWLFGTEAAAVPAGVSLVAGGAIAEARVRPPRWRAWRAWAAVLLGWLTGGSIGWLVAATHPLLALALTTPVVLVGLSLASHRPRPRDS